MFVYFRNQQKYNYSPISPKLSIQQNFEVQSEPISQNEYFLRTETSFHLIVELILNMSCSLFITDINHFHSVILNSSWRRVDWEEYPCWENWQSCILSRSWEMFIVLGVLFENIRNISIMYRLFGCSFISKMLRFIKNIQSKNITKYKFSFNVLSTFFIFHCIIQNVYAFIYLQQIEISVGGREK